MPTWKVRMYDHDNIKMQNYNNKEDFSKAIYDQVCELVVLFSK